jgi:hypothetical protein
MKWMKMHNLFKPTIDQKYIIYYVNKIWFSHTQTNSSYQFLYWYKKYHRNTTTFKIVIGWLVRCWNFNSLMENFAHVVPISWIIVPERYTPAVVNKGFSQQIKTLQLVF